MRIAIASDIYYPMTNGVAVFAKNLAEGLSRMGHEVLVICPSFTGKYHVRKDKETGVTVASLTSRRFPFYPDQISKVPEQKEILGRPVKRVHYKNGIWWSVNPWYEVSDLLDKFEPDVIHLQTAETIALATLTYVNRYDIPLVSTGHAYPDNITGQFKVLKPVKKPIDAAVKTYMNSFLKHSEYATMPTEMAIGDLIPKKKRRFNVPVEAISNGVDLSAFSPGKVDVNVLKKYGLNKGARRLLYVGRVDPEKSIDKVLLAFRDALVDVPKAELVIVGDGIALAELRDMAKELNIEKNVKFLGKVKLPELTDIYRSATAFVIASETETQGLVLIEAAAVGLPLIAVDAGAVKEVCQDGRNGVLCSPGDIAGIASGMVKLLKDARLCKRYGKASLEIAAQHDLNKTLARFVEIYKEAIKLNDTVFDKSFYEPLTF